MEPTNIEFIGAPCGKHGPYTFFKAFKYSRGEKLNILCLGQFFFVKILEDARVCIGEIQLLWEDRNHEGAQLSSVRLYFLPEHTPDGRQPRHGEDEILAETEKVVLRVEDLIQWIVEDPVTWTKGFPAVKEKVEGPENGKTDELLKIFAANNSGLNFKDVQKEKRNLKENLQPDTSTEVVILSYSSYCRYRSILLRLENCTNKWMKNAIVNAIGGFTLKTDNARVLFCRDTFEHPDLEDHDFRRDWLAPNLKGRPRKKKLVFKKDDSDYCNSEESENSMDKDIKPVVTTPSYMKAPERPQIKFAQIKKEDSKPVVLLKPNNKGRFTVEEEDFLHKLYSFMRNRGTPIERIPTLGFREVDLYEFYAYSQQLGGYEDITQKRLWKHIYDKLGGHPANTSAATCTRRHYEKLLLPYERHLRGEGHKPLPQPYHKPRRVSDGTTEEKPPQTETITVPTVTPPQVPLSTRNWKADIDFIEKEKQWEEMRRMKNLNKDKGAMVRKTVKAELLYRQQVKAEQRISPNDHYTDHGQSIPRAIAKVELPEFSKHTTKENHSMSHDQYRAHPTVVARNDHMHSQAASTHSRTLQGQVAKRHTQLLPGNHSVQSNSGARDMPINNYVPPSSQYLVPSHSRRPSVIQQVPGVSNKHKVLNPAPSPRPHLPKTVYGPPHIMIPTQTGISPLTTSPANNTASSAQKRPYPFSNNHCLPKMFTTTNEISKESEVKPSISIRDLDPYYNNIKRSNTEHRNDTAESSLYTSKIKEYVNNASSPIVIEDEADQPLDFSMKTLKKIEKETHNNQLDLSVGHMKTDAPVNLSVFPKSRDCEAVSSRHVHDATVGLLVPQSFTSPYSVPTVSRLEENNRVHCRDQRHETDLTRDSMQRYSSQSQLRALSVPITVPSTAMAAIVHPAFPTLSGSNMLPSGVMSPQYAQPFIYQTPLQGVSSSSQSQIISAIPSGHAATPSGQASIPAGQALFLPAGPYVLPAAHLYPHIYGQAAPVPISQSSSK